MPALRLAHAAIFLLALIAVFTFWSQVGGQDHLDLLPPHVKAGLSLLCAFAAARAAHSASIGSEAWNARTLRWLGVALLALALCGLASYYAHSTLEPAADELDEEQVAAAPVAPDVAAMRVP